jgi:hypothetical protein
MGRLLGVDGDERDFWTRSGSAPCGRIRIEITDLGKVYASARSRLNCVAETQQSLASQGPGALAGSFENETET